MSYANKTRGLNQIFMGMLLAGLIACGGTENADSSHVIISADISQHVENELMADLSIELSQAADMEVVIKSTGLATRTLKYQKGIAQYDETLIGFRAETDYQVTIRSIFSDGAIDEETIDYRTGTLSVDLPEVELVEASEESFGGLTFLSVTGDNARYFAVDEHGEPVWYLHESVPMMSNSPYLRYLGEGRILLVLMGELRIINALGETDTTIPLPSFHHDAIITPDGNIMVLANEYGSFDGKRLKGDLIQEYTTSGELLWQWSSFENLDTSRFPGQLSQVEVNNSYDWSHSNSLFYYDEDSLLLSVRSQNWVVSIDKDSKQINWILGDSEGTTESALTDKFLTLNSGSWPSAQHAAMKMANGDILIYDNRNDSAIAGVGVNSRAVIYSVDEETMSATETWEYIDEKYSRSLGDVDELPNKNILVVSGGPGSSNDALITEVEISEEVAKVWQIRVPGEKVYRAERIGWDELEISE